MRKINVIAVLIVSLFCFLNISAQGVDIPIPFYHTNKLQVEISTALNGYVFSVDRAINQVNQAMSHNINYSLDNGNTWIHLGGTSGIPFDDVDVLVTHINDTSLRVFTAYICHQHGDTGYTLNVIRHDLEIAPNGGIIINTPFPPTVFHLETGTRKIYDVELASDYNFPAVGTSPYSIALTYTSEGINGIDSLNFAISKNAGNSFQNTRNVAIAPNIRKAAIAYGRSASSYNGRYYLAWEQFDSATATKGHIYTARNVSTVNGSLTPPYQLDNISSSMENLCRNPRIAISHDTTDNDSAAMTAVILVDRDYNADGSDYDVLGLYSKNPNNGYWSRLDVANGSTSDMQADIIYDPANNNFLATYLDSTNGKLLYIKNTINLNNPNSWTVVDTQYNDLRTGLRNAYPRIAVSPANNMAAFAWVQQNDTGKGIAYFDTEYRPAITTTLTETTCANQPFSFNGRLLNTPGFYRDTFPTPAGDSIVILNLSINSLEAKSLTQSICAGDVFVFNGQNLSTSGTYFDTIAASIGCDTLLSLTVTVNVIVTPVISQSGARLNVQRYNSYQWKLNDSDIPLANGQSYTAIENGMYTVEVTDTNGCSSISAGVLVTGVGISDIEDAGITVYPNPTTDVLYIESANTNTVKISNLNGSIILEKVIGKKEALNVSDFAKGIYILQIIHQGKTATMKFAKH